MRFAILSSLLVALSLGAVLTPDSPAALEAQLESAAEPMLTADVVTEITLGHCGYFNAFYMEGTVVLCQEDLVDPAWRAVLDHELAHGVIRQLEVPFTGSEETAADELATVRLLEANRPGDVLAVAAKLEGLGSAVADGDPHEAPDRRAYEMRCLVIGWALDAGDGTGVCVDYWHRAKRSWDTLAPMWRP